MRALLLAAGILLTVSALAQSQTPDNPAPATSSITSSPVPVPEPSDKAMSYYRSGVAWWLLDVAWGITLPALLLFTGFSARMRTWAARLGRKWFFVIGVYFILFSLITFVLDLPRAYHEEFARQHAYGLSNQTFHKWAGDAVTALLVILVAGVLFLWVPYLLLRKAPQRWWLYTGLLAVPFLCFILLVTPVWIDPLFNTFGSMKNTTLEAKIPFVKLQQDNLGNPRPHWLVTLWRASHPTLAERIEFCNAYRPWEQEQPLAYQHLFK